MPSETDSWDFARVKRVPHFIDRISGKLYLHSLNSLGLLLRVANVIIRSIFKLEFLILSCHLFDVRRRLPWVGASFSRGRTGGLVAAVLEDVGVADSRLCAEVECLGQD